MAAFALLVQKLDMKDIASLSLIVPAFNEEANIEITLTRAIAYLSRTVPRYEIVVVNDGSADETAAIVRRLMGRHPEIALVEHSVNRGYGAALRSGFDRARLEYILLMDSDGQLAIEDLDRFWPFFERYDAVIGYREKRADARKRLVIAWVFHRVMRLLFGLRFKDIDCAFKLFPRSAYEAVRPLRSEGALVSAELLARFVRADVRVKEVAVRHFPRAGGQSKGATIPVILTTLKECFRLKHEFWRTRKHR